ncbi:Eukaryotic translation initiation factor 4E-binding protein 2 [Takifugu flavidus]|uniref:Eukaryotic translation initiation factor 4E-binding protein 2 n=1 Tax=Takifugu flavidus TaxID=433684 RepID=A0A5C6PGQ5_9TELE|nr:Eukaryotic translation initiation factor 4E-binding protein 2 [Takifugu flavidus]
MSRQLSESRAIPTRTVLINDTTQLPHDYCTTPGGTLFSTTPGAHLPVIPGVTSQNVVRENKKNEANNRINKHDDKSANGDDAQFEMDI